MNEVASWTSTLARRTTWTLMVSAIAIAGAACKSDPPPTAAASVATPPPPSPSATASAKPAAPWYQGKWEGTLEAKAVAIALEEKAANEKAWSKDDGSKNSGKGAVTLTISPDGQATGSASGALGDATLSGTVDEERVTLRFSPKDATDPESLSGVVVLAQKGETLEGELNASTGDSLRVRKASLTLKKAP